MTNDVENLSVRGLRQCEEARRSDGQCPGQDGAGQCAHAEKRAPKSVAFKGKLSSRGRANSHNETQSS